MTHIWSSKHEFKNFIADNPGICIGTLGPQGTSCDHTLNILLNGMPEANRSKVLINNFDDVFSSLNERRIDIAMVPAAYTHITEFFWASDFLLIGTIVSKTPDYHFAKSIGVEKVRRIASCAAVEHMLKDQFAHCVQGPYELLPGLSTLASALDVVEGRADACITNDGGIRGVQLDIIHTQKGVDMLWSFFRRKE